MSEKKKDENSYDYNYNKQTHFPGSINNNYYTADDKYIITSSVRRLFARNYETFLINAPKKKKKK